MPNLLQTIHSPADLRAVPRHQLPALADELRSFVLNSVIAKAKVFARMGPDDKASLVEKMQTILQE